MIVVRKTVQGPATGGFTVLVSCDTGEVLQATLNFDTAGLPTTFSGGLEPWSVTPDGAWKFNSNVPEDVVDCTVTETDAGGASTTSWTCDYVLEQRNGGTVIGGCDAPTGTGTGPVGFELADEEQEVVMQVATVHFTNTIPAPAVEAAPTFTG